MRHQHPHLTAAGGDRSRARRTLAMATMVVGALLTTGGLTAGVVAGAEPDTQTVAFDPIGPPRYGGDRCPDVGHYWNFVVEPGAFEFRGFQLDLGGSLIDIPGSAIIPRAGMGDVYVEVPRPYSLDQLRWQGSSADVTPATATETPSVRLAHLCYGPLAPPPSTTTTTVAETTTTTTPAVEPLSVTGVCAEIDVSGATTRYWHQLTNGTAVPVEVTWADGAATIPAHGSTLESSDSPLITLAVGDEVVATSSTPADDTCEATATVTKIVEGPERQNGDEAPVYTMQVSRLVDGTYVPEGDPFELIGGESVEIPIPSTFNPEGIQYRIVEIDPGGADTVSITPDTFVVHGHRTQSVSITVRNGFAAIELTKTVDNATTAIGENLTYNLVAENAGGVTLDPVTIYDRLPTQVEYVTATVAGDAGSCVVLDSTRPQLVRCDLDDALVPGGVTAAVDITVVVVEPVSADEVITNQAMVIGDFDGNALTGIHGGALTQAPSCVPTIGEVCDLSAAVSSGTNVASAAPPPTVTSTTLLSNGAATTTTVALRLPETGLGGGWSAAIAGLVLVAMGSVLLLTARRPVPRTTD